MFSCLTGLVSEVFDRDIVASFLRLDFETALGAGMDVSEIRRDEASSGPRDDWENRSILIIAQAIFLNSVAPGATSRSSIETTEQRSRWLSWMSLPL